jgi:glycosyltransferase involved in cell wall biosynthesis
MPRVGVVIPTYRRPELLAAAIRSVLAQTYQDFEIVVVDDNSGDDTEQVVRSFGDARIRYVAHDRNRRCGAAKNTGVRSSTSELVAFLDDDDEWLPRKLERQVAVLDQSPAGTGVVYTGFQEFDRSTGAPLRTFLPPKSGRMLDVLGRNAVGPPSAVLVRRSCFAEVGYFDEVLEFGEDWDFWIRLAERVEFASVPEALVRYGIHSSRMTTNIDWRIRGLEKFKDKHLAYLESHPRELSDFYLGLGLHYLHVGRTGNGRAAFWHAVRLSPHRLKPYQHLVLSIFGARFHLAVVERSAKRHRISLPPGKAA